MRIVFKKVTLENFMSYKEASVTLDRHGYILVNGINNNPVDNAKSNGTGKSTLFSAISWALTGLTVGGGKEVANIHTDGTTSVEVEFYLDSVHYRVLRTKNPSNLKVYIDGENKSGKGIRDTEKLLSEYLPDVTHSLINSVIILGQGLPQKFTNNSPSGRKEVLEKLSNSDFMITDLKNRVIKRLEKVKSDIRECENNLTDLSARKDILTKQIESYNLQLGTEFTDEILSELNNKLIEVDKAIDVISISVTSYEEQINSIDEQIITTNASVMAKTNEYIQNKNNLELEDTAELDKEILELSSKIKSLKSEITKLDSIKDTCPTCGQKLPDVHKIDTSDRKEEVKLLQEELNTKSNRKMTITANNNKIIAEYDQAFSNSVLAERNRITSLEDEKKSAQAIMNSEKSSLSTLHNDKARITSKIESFDKDKTYIKNQIEDCKSQIDTFIEKILYYNERMVELSSRLEINNKMSTILKRDFRGYLLSNVIEFIESQAKSYSKELFNSDGLGFTLDGNNISITYDSKDYEVLSGGEKQKVDVIIQLSIRDMLCKFLNFSSNILVLDEITDSLDSTGSQKMFNLISTRLNDVEAIYIVSHHTDFEIPVDSEITVVKGSDKISRIVQQ